MRGVVITLTLAMTAFGFVWAQQAAESTESEGAALSKYLQYQRYEMTRVTPKPYRIFSNGSSLICAPVFPQSAPHDPHDDHWIHVFVSPDGKKAMSSGKGVYPEGTIILKQKFFNANGETTDFFTGMRKRERGYNPTAGDWEFFTTDRSGEKVTARGKIDSCMECHTKYKATDFVSRRYLTQKEDSGW